MNLLKTISFAWCILIVFVPLDGTARELAHDTWDSLKVDFGLKGHLDLTKLSLEELMAIEVTSVSRKTEKLSEAAAAIFVITNEDIRRSGATSIPEVLRMVPGVQVAHIDANKWAISARGFNGRFSNKLLVLIDGRTVYSPLYSGVFWEAQDVMLEDVEQIEIIRGPGATLWGANAVNGVINVITKKVWDTQGGFVTVGGGTEERGFGTARYGGTLGRALAFRLYTRYFNRDAYVDANGRETADKWDALKGGFRLDWNPPSGQAITLQGDMLASNQYETLTTTSQDPPYVEIKNNLVDITDVNILARWQRDWSNTSQMAVQLSYSRFNRTSSIAEFLIDSYDIDFQHRFSPLVNQEIVWGWGYHTNRDDLRGVFSVDFNPTKRRDTLLSAFLQDEIVLVSDRLQLTIGSKFEDNDYTGFEIQPNARFVWTPRKEHTVWASVARAARTPSRAEYHVQLIRLIYPAGYYDPNLPAFVTVTGDESFDSEYLLAYELGYRLRPHASLSCDLTTFYNVYDGLRTMEPGMPFPELTTEPAHIVIPISANNKMRGETYGFELASHWRVLEWWQVYSSYSYLQMKLRTEQDSQDIIAENAEEESPHHQIYIRSSKDLRDNLHVDVGLRYADALPSLDVNSYITLDVRVGWYVTASVELSLIGQNLLDDHHPEFTPEFLDTQPTEVERGVYGALRFTF